MNFKKFLTAVIFTLGVFTSAGIMAQSTYTYTEAFSVGRSTNAPTYFFSGQFVVASGSGNQAVLSWSNLTFGTNSNYSNPAATSLGDASALWGNGYGTYNAADNYFTGGVVPFAASSSFNNQNHNSSWVLGMGEITSNLWACGTVACNDANFQGWGKGYTTTFVSSVGAPEIDGSLAPKVGFLLGCLFLMFGRKKQNTEALLTA